MSTTTTGAGAGPAPTCGWIWHDGRMFHHCPLATGHRGLHARNSGIVPTAAEVKEIEHLP